MRVAAMQSALTGYRPDTFAQALAACAANGVDLLVTPECYFGGMPPDPAAARAVAIGAPYEELTSAAGSAPAGLTLVAGFTERAAGRLHSSAAVLRNGEVLGVSRKLFPREPVFSPGQDVPVYDIGGQRIGISICSDLNYVEPARLLALDGARILVCPLNNDLPSDVARRWHTRTRSNLVARAVENDCWVVSADVCGAGAGRSGGAATCVVAPDGGVVAAAGPEPGLVLAEVVTSVRSLQERWQARANPAVWRRWTATQGG